MGLKDSRCDSCEEEVNFLFPIAVIQELPSGGEQMVLRYYCKDCYDIMLDAAQDEMDNKDNDNDEEEDNVTPDEDTKCACCSEVIKPDKDENISEYFCYGCHKYICETCSETLETIGVHTLEDHRKACKEKGNHT